MKAEYINHMGSDLSVVNAARVSFDKESEWGFDRSAKTLDEAEALADKLNGTVDTDYIYSDRWMGGYPVQYLKPEDAKLIRYLAKHNHWTPFAHTSISLRMSAPVPIRTQCFKHKQGLVENEESRRYISGTPEVFYPETWRKAPTNGAKQGSSDEEIIWLKEDQWMMTTSVKAAYRDAVGHSMQIYARMIESGVCPEQARFVLPQGCEVNWIWTGNLYAFANFYLKRTEAHAQKEIRDLAEDVGKIVQPLFPVSWAALTAEV